MSVNVACVVVVVVEVISGISLRFTMSFELMQVYVRLKMFKNMPKTINYGWFVS